MERLIWSALKDVLNHQSLQTHHLPRSWQDHPEKFAASKDWKAIVAIEGMMTLLKKPQESSEKRTFHSDGSDGFQDVKAYFEALDQEIQKAVLGALKFAQKKVQRAVEDRDRITTANYNNVFPAILDAMFRWHDMIAIPQNVPKNIKNLLTVIEPPKAEFNVLSIFSSGHSSSR
jgi:hypothetical protein